MEDVLRSDNHASKHPKRRKSTSTAYKTIPLEMISLESVEKRNSLVTLERAAWNFFAEVEDVKKEVIVLRCLPLNVKDIRLQSGQEKTTKACECVTRQQNIQNIEEDLKSLYSYMKELKKTHGMPLEMAHYVCILCRLQDIRDSVRDYKKSIKVTKSEDRLKPTVDDSGNAEEHKKKDKREKTKLCPKWCPKCCSKQCFKCCVKKPREKKDKKDEKVEDKCTCTKEDQIEKPCEDALFVPCVVDECGKQRKSGELIVESHKNLCEIKVCRKDQCTSGTNIPNKKPLIKNCEKEKECKCDNNVNPSISRQEPKCKCNDQAVQTVEQAMGNKMKDGKTESTKNKKSINENSEKEKKETTDKKSSPKVNTETKQLPEIQIAKSPSAKAYNDKYDDKTSKIDKTEAKTFCNFCYGKTKSVINENLADELKKIVGQSSGTVFLKISGVDEKLYHIQVSTSAKNNLGCIFVTDKALIEAKKLKVFKEYITLCLATSSYSLPNIKKLVDYPFEICNR